MNKINLETNLLEYLKKDINSGLTQMGKKSFKDFANESGFTPKEYIKGLLTRAISKGLEERG